MALFLNQNERRTQLQEKIAAELSDRIKNKNPDKPADVGSGILEDSQEASGRSLIWVGVITAAVIALVVFVLFIFNGV
ncbi:MAG TPA: hypothetical protein VM581_03825 [Magnetospirillaceae bacterium]|nr:hypothetical protein [Magnetospirillaceae bacterium]